MTEPARDRPRGAPLLVGPTPDVAHASLRVTVVAGGLALLAAWYGLSALGEYGYLLALVPAGAGALLVGSATLGSRFVVHGARLTRPGGLGRREVSVDLAAATVVGTGAGLRVEAGGVGVEVPPDWEQAGFLRALVDAAHAGLLAGARRPDPWVTIPDATLGTTGGSLLGWAELVLFVSDAGAPEALAAFTGRPVSGGVRARDVLALVEVLEPSRVRAGLARWKGLSSARAWPRDQCLVSPFPPWPKRDHYDSTVRDCPLEVSRGMEVLTARLTFGEAAEVASSLGLEPPK